MAILLRTALAASTLLLAGMGGASGQSVSFPEPGDPLPWAKDRTYADLVRLAVPGTAGAGASEIRHIAGEDAGGGVPAPNAAPRIAAIPVRSGGHDRMALLLDFGEAGEGASGLAVLALFDMAADPLLLDAADVAFDRRTSFMGPARLPVSIGDDLLATRSTHSNSGQGYATAALILVRDDRLELVDTIFTFDDRACTHERTQRLDIRQGAERPFRDIVATVTERTAASGEDCGDATAPEPGTRTIAVTYRWDAAGQRYLPGSDAFHVLARENEERF